MEKRLDCAAALLLIISAIFWFLSAYGKLPPMKGYWGETPEGDPFYAMVKFSAAMNRWAAGFSCAAALSMAVKLFISKS
jgi:Na+/proline symporter